MRQAQIDTRWRSGELQASSGRYTGIKQDLISGFLVPGGRYLLLVMKDLSVLRWDLQNITLEATIAVPRSPWEWALKNYAADLSPRVVDQCNFVLQTFMT